MTHATLLASLKEALAQKLRLDPDALDIYAPLADYGLDSLEAVNFTGEIETLLGQRIDPMALWEHETVWELSVYLAEQAGLPIDLPDSEEELDALLKTLTGEAENEQTEE